jgi:hypothetical protein
MTYWSAQRTFAEGRDSTACRWRAEPGGVFLDFTRLGESLHLVFHEMQALPEGDPNWHPVRGHPLIVTRTDTADFLANSVPNLHGCTRRRLGANVPTGRTAMTRMPSP